MTEAERALRWYESLGWCRLFRMERALGKRLLIGNAKPGRTFRGASAGGPRNTRVRRSRVDRSMPPSLKGKTKTPRSGSLGDRTFGYRRGSTLAEPVVVSSGPTDPVEDALIEDLLG